MLNYDLLANCVLYIFGACFTYVTFNGSQVFRILYIERMASPIHRQVTKFFEYLFLLMSGLGISFISDYQGPLYYIGDLILLGLVVRQFIKSDHVQRSEYLRHYNYSKHKLVNRMITNLIHYPTHHDN